MTISEMYPTVLVDEYRRLRSDDRERLEGAVHPAIDLDAGVQAASVADPILSADGLSLYYSVIGPSLKGPSIFVSHRTGDEDWPLGKPLDECELNRSKDGARHPSALSVDQRTLFYYDELRAIERAAWRPAPDRPFDTFVDLPMISAVQVNGACDHLYYSQSDSSDRLNVLVAPQK